ncbi:MAG: hypothetical protein WA828_20415, partial [Coleofasciculaceae cyanobacterium]
MKMQRFWGQPVALMVVLSAMSSLIAPAQAIPEQTTNTLQLAQRDLVGQCRAANQRLPIYRQPTTASPSDRILVTAEQVKLADNGNSNGWIRISAPIAGFVEAAKLMSCSGNVVVNPTPPRPAPAPAPAPTQTQINSRCRVVIYNGPEGGLAIRSRPDRTAPRTDGVKFGDRVTLRTSPPPSNIDKDGR